MDSRRVVPRTPRSDLPARWAYGLALGRVEAEVRAARQQGRGEDERARAVRLPALRLGGIPGKDREKRVRMRSRAVATEERAQ